MDGGGAEGHCLAVASGQDGLIERRQALARGLSEKQIEIRLRSGRWAIELPGVYRTGGAPRTWLQRLRAACLWADRDFAISHRAAAALRGLARFKEGPVELSVTRCLRAPTGVILHRVGDLQIRDIRIRGGLHVTTPARTLVDLCGCEPTQTLEATADEMLRRRLATLDELEAALARLKHRRGTAFLSDLVARYRGGEKPAESELESRAIELIDDAGLPRPTKQVPVNAGGRRYRLDLLYPRQRVVVEAQGFVHYSDPAATDRDRIRRNALAAKGLLVLEWTWNAIRDDPGALGLQLADALAR